MASLEIEQQQGPLLPYVKQHWHDSSTGQQVRVAWESLGKASDLHAMAAFLRALA